MSESTSSMLLIGIGTSGCSIARRVANSFGEDMRYIMADTDAKSGEAGGPFTLIGSNRLSGRGAGGDVVAARLAAEDSMGDFDSKNFFSCICARYRKAGCPYPRFRQGFWCRFKIRS